MNTTIKLEQVDKLKSMLKPSKQMCFAVHAFKGEDWHIMHVIDSYPEARRIAEQLLKHDNFEQVVIVKQTKIITHEIVSILSREGL